MENYQADLPSVAANALSTVPVDFLVVIINTARRPIFFYEEWNSMGHDNLEIDISLRDSGKTFHLRKKGGIWIRNIPSAIAVPPGSCVAYPVAIDTNIWTNVPIIGVGVRGLPLYGLPEGDLLQGDTILVRASVVPCFVNGRSQDATFPRGRVFSDWTPLKFRMTDSMIPP